MRSAKGGYFERIDHEGYPIQYAIEGRWVFNRFESWIIHAYLWANEFWYERVWAPVAIRALHAVGRHHYRGCRGNTRCHPLIRTTT